MVDEVLYAKLVNHARRVLPPDPAIEAGDLVNTALLKAWRWLDGERSEEERLKYLHTAIDSVANSARRGYRGRGIAQTMPLEEWRPSGANVEAQAIARANLGAIVALVLAGDVFAAAVLAYALCGGTEGAAMLGWPQSTFNTRVWRFRHERAGLEA